MKSYLLKDLVEIQQGFAFKSKDYVSESNTSSFRMSNIRPGGVVDLNHNLKFLPDIFKDQYKDFLLKEGDLVMAMTDMAQNPKILGIPSIISRLDKNYLLNQRVARFKYINKDVVDQKYLYYYFLSPQVRKYLISEGSGGLQINLSSKSIYNLQVPVPSLQEQEKIVERLDKVFNSTSNKKQNLMRQENNIKILLNSFLNNVFFEDNFAYASIKEISEITNGYAFKSSDFITTSATKVIKITDVGVGCFNNDKPSFLPENFKSLYKDFIISKGSIVIALTRTVIKDGLKVAIVPDEYDKSLLNQRVASISANQKIVESLFLYFYLSTKTVQKYVEEKANTLMQPNLSITDLKNLKIPIPELSKQKEIIDKIQLFIDNYENLIKIFNQEYSLFLKLEKSILNKEFSYE